MAEPASPSPSRPSCYAPPRQGAACAERLPPPRTRSGSRTRAATCAARRRTARTDRREARSRAADIALKAKQEDASAGRRSRRKECAEEGTPKTSASSRKSVAESTRTATATKWRAMRAQRRARGAAPRSRRKQQCARRPRATAHARDPEADWIRRIQAKVKGNVIVPSELAGNPGGDLRGRATADRRDHRGDAAQVERQPRLRRRRAARDPQVVAAAAARSSPTSSSALSPSDSGRWTERARIFGKTSSRNSRPAEMSARSASGGRAFRVKARKARRSRSASHVAVARAGHITESP